MLGRLASLAVGCAIFFVAHGSTGILSVVSLFFCFIYSLAGWGALMAPRSPLGFRLAVSSAFAAIAAGAFGHLGLLSASWVFVVILFVGFCFHSAPSRRFPHSAVTWSAFALLAFVLLTRAMQAVHFWGATDPLWYHLTGPRLWVESGAIRFFPNSPYIFQCRYWEYLYLWAFELCPPVPLQSSPTNLIEAQIFCQLIHAVLGYAVSLLLVYELCVKRMMIPKHWAALAALAAGMIPSLTFTSVIANNDWGAVSWFLAALCLTPSLFRAEVLATRRRLFACGSFYGLAFAAKFNVGVEFVPVFLVSLLMGFARGNSAREVVRRASTVAAGFLLLAGPILARNFIATGNPVFPEMNSVFPSALLSDSLKQAQSQAFAGNQWRSLGQILEKIGHLLFHEKMGIAGIFVLLPLLRKRWLDVFPLVAAIAVSVVLFLVKEKQQELRLLGPALVLSQVALVVSLALLARKSRFAHLIFFGCLALAIYASDIFPTGVMPIGFSPVLFGNPSLLATPSFVMSSPDFSTLLVSKTMGGGAKAWLRSHAQLGERIVTTGDSQTYYLAGFDAFAGDESPAFNAAAQAAFDRVDAPGLIPILEAFHVDYVLDTYRFPQKSWTYLSLMTERLSQQYPDSVVYSDPAARVFSVKKLVSGLLAGHPE